MRLLLDTHVFLWWRARDRRIRAVRKTIGHADVVYVSAASAWEIAIKTALGKLSIPEPVSVGIADSDFDELPVTVAHAERVGTLPHHHADPFDRLLLAQALCESLVLVTADVRLRTYGVPLVEV